MYYVYHLIDPRDAKVFYVGKGKGTRVHHHEREAAAGIYSRKCNLIRDIMASGHQVGKLIVARFDDELLAYAAEKAEIAQIGLENLTNVYPGGIYWEPRTLPEKQPFKWTVSRLTDIAPKMARALGLIATTGGLVACGYDITDTILEIAGQMIRDTGKAAFNTAMNNQGLKINLA